MRNRRWDKGSWSKKERLVTLKKIGENLILFLFFFWRLRPTFPCFVRTPGASSEFLFTSWKTGSLAISGLEDAKSIRALKRGSGFRRTACPYPGMTCPDLRVLHR